MSNLKSITHGLKAAAASLFSKEENEFVIAGRTLVCTHCDGTKFKKRTYKMTTVFREGLLADDASVLICKGCSRIEWFNGDI